MHGNRGDIVKAVETIRQTVDVPGAPSDEVSRLGCVGAQLAVLSGTMSADDATAVARHALEVATADDDASTRCVAHQLLGAIAASTGYGATAMEHIGASLLLFESGRVTAYSYLIPDAFAAVCLLTLDRLDEALEMSYRARRRAEQRGAVALLPLSYMATCGSHYYSGRFDEALTEAEAARSVMEDIGSRNFVLYVDAICARIALHRGDTTLAGQLLADGTQQLSTGGSMFGVDWLLHAQADLLEATGDLEGAMSLSEMAWHQMERLRFFWGMHKRAEGLVRRAMAAGREDFARSVVADMEEAARRSPAASTRAAAVLGRARVEHDHVLAAESLSVFRATPLRPEIAACSEALAALLAEAGQRREAVAALRESRGLFDEIGASGDSARVDRALAELGERIRRPVAARPTFGWESVTAMELKVCRFVAEGLTNPQIGAQLFISRRTVETLV